MKVLWFSYIEEVVCNRDDLILNPLFNSEPMKMFVSVGNGTSKSILNMLKALNLTDG